MARTLRAALIASALAGSSAFTLTMGITDGPGARPRQGSLGRQGAMGGRVGSMVGWMGDGQISQKEYNMGFDTLDKDNDGFITRSEFGIASKVYFDLLDKDGDGKITREEYKLGFVLMGPEAAQRVRERFNTRQGSSGPQSASKRQTQYDNPLTLAEKLAAFFDPRLQDGKGDRQNMPIPKWRNGPRGQGANDGGGSGNVYGSDDRYGKKPDNLRKW